ncbi:hypothetical protein PaG_03729 [Moesziomyces aphidis]|uniref:Uncharacterized protein n=1 Tax=Moesziomyces aphidis TaxID=84754 RepID=W3VKG8_MOEAP|nr:hypothetical protein PaG_03729 [Moesziomyces aphidis]
MDRRSVLVFLNISPSYFNEELAFFTEHARAEGRTLVPYTHPDYPGEYGYVCTGADDSLVDSAKFLVRRHDYIRLWVFSESDFVLPREINNSNSLDNLVSSHRALSG